MVKSTGRGLVVKRPGVLSKVQMLNLVLGVGVFLFHSSNRNATERNKQRKVCGLFEARDAGTTTWIASLARSSETCTLCHSSRR